MPHPFFFFFFEKGEHLVLAERLKLPVLYPVSVLGAKLYLGHEKLALCLQSKWYCWWNWSLIQWGWDFHEEQLFSVDHIPCLSPAKWLMSLTVVVIGFTAAAHSADVIWLDFMWKWLRGVVTSFTSGHIMFLSVLPCVLHCFNPCFLFLWVACLLCLSAYISDVPSVTAWLVKTCGALISHVGQIRMRDLCLCVCPQACTHIFMVCFVWPWFCVMVHHRLVSF